MQLAWIVRRLALVSVLGLTGLVCGCGSQSPAEKAEASKIIQESHKKAHQQLKADSLKVGAPRGRR